MSQIKIQNLNLFYGDKQALKDINLNISQKEVVAFIGPSGCGKSTLLRCINRMNDYIENCTVSGLIEIDDKDIQKIEDINHFRKKVGMVFQKPTVFATSIYENIAYAIKTHKKINKYDLEQRIEKALKQSFIWDEVKDKLHSDAIELSGGQQQRLCIARTIATNPEIILMDEPTSALDPKSTLKIEELINQLKEQFTIIIVTHNMQQAHRIANKTAFFLNGRIIEMNTTEIIFEKPENPKTYDYIHGVFG